MTVDIPYAIIDEVSRGRGSLFLGAGASKEAGFPGSSELSNFLSDKAGSKLSKELKDKPLDFVAERLYSAEGYGKQWVRSQIISLFNQFHKTAKSPPSEAHYAITTIKWRTIFTTNYDRLIEISYDGNHESVQQHLPVFNPDLQIKYHEEDIVRIIKLNGSFDEAARNSNHNLVLTFSDQQEARRTNDLFYKLLEEEAINGPIIFAGFRFIHPGTNQYATSPEFNLLKELLLLMGPAARWHYCILPFDKSKSEDTDFVDELKRYKILVINASLGEFLSELQNRLNKRTTYVTPTKTLHVPIGTSVLEVSQADYSRDKRQFEILHQEMFLGETPEIRESLNGGETWLSFYHGHFIERDCKQEFLKKIREGLQMEEPSIILLSAPIGWGKTFLLKDISLSLYRSGRPIIWLNPLSNIEIPGENGISVIVGKWDSDRLASVLRSMVQIVQKGTHQPTDSIPIIIADECIERVEELFYMIDALRRQKLKAVFILSVSDDEISELTEIPNLSKAIVFFPKIYCNLRLETEKLVDFCIEKGILGDSLLDRRNIVLERIINEEAELLLIFALQVIYDKNHRPFKQIVDGFWKNLDNDIQRKIVHAVSSLHRFGNIFTPRIYTITKVFKYVPMLELINNYNICLRKRILFEHMDQDEPCIATLHPLIAEKYLGSYQESSLSAENELLDVIKNMTTNRRDLEVIRKLLRRINDHKYQFLNIGTINALFEMAVKVTEYDWVVSQQYSKFLVGQELFPKALEMINLGIRSNPKHVSLYHTRGNIRKKWGERLHVEGNLKDAKEQFDLAGKDFSISRVRYEPDEYGFVTHLDMLIYLIEHETNEQKKIDYRVEGHELYEEGLQTVPQRRIKYLMNNKYQSNFSPAIEVLDTFCEKIELALQNRNASVYSAAFYAKRIYEKDPSNYAKAVNALSNYSQTYHGILSWVTEAELHIRESKFAEAARCINSAKMLEASAERQEVVRSLYYWDLIVSFILEEYVNAIRAQKVLDLMKYFVKESYPRGYIWKKSSKNKKIEGRTLAEDAKLWVGRLRDMKTGGHFGTISLSNNSGETFYINFDPEYFKRKDLRVGDQIQFVVTILPNRLRADDPKSKHFTNTRDDIYV